MAKNVRMSLTVTEELWKKISHLSVEEGKSKNDLILELIEKSLKEKHSVTK